MDFFKHLFGQKTLITAELAEIDKIILYMKEIVVRDDLIGGILQNYKQAQTLPDEAKIPKYIQIYFALEQFINENKPLVVHRTLTKEQLRQEIRTKFNVPNLPEPFRIIFLSEKEQLVYLYKRYTQSLASFIANQTGSNSVQKIIAFVPPKQNVIPPVFENDKLDCSLLQNNLKSIETPNLKAYFKSLSGAMFREIDISFGPKTAIDITEKEYAAIKEMYDYEIISKYLAIAPDGILDRDRIAYMTRDELEKQAKAVVEERVHRELAEKATRDLQRAVEERTKELNAEKEELRKNDAKLLASIRSVPVGLILTDSSDGIVAINDVAKKIVQVEKEISKIAELSELMKHKLDFVSNINECKFQKRPRELKDFEFFDKILNITFTPIFLSSPDSAYVGAVILLNDITDAKLLDRAKDDFFAIASHELRTPLTAIRGYLSLIQDYYSKDITNQQISNMLQNMDKSSQHLIEIVNEFLDMSRLEQGRIEFKFQTFNMSDLIKEVINEVGTLAESKQTYLRFENQDATFHDVYADRERAKQIIANLIGNAIKFTDTGGVSVTAEEKEGFIFVKVKDSGKGIPLANQNLLFKKFQKASANPLAKDAKSGSGLGLYISKKLATGMKGDVYLESSEEDKGSTFAVKTPVATGNEPQPVQPLATQGIQTQPPMTVPQQ